MSANPLRVRAVAAPAWGAAAQAMVRAAQAVAQPGGPALYGELVRELADTLGAASACIAVHADGARLRMRSLAAVLDGQLLSSFDYPLDGSPCAQVRGHDFVYIESGAAQAFASTTMPAAQGMDSYAAIALNDGDDTPLGLLVVMDRRPIAEPALAEAMLKIFASRIVAEIARGRADEALHTAALAVSSARGESVFTELARYLATVLHCELAFVARTLPEQPRRLSMLAMCLDGEIQRDFDYALDGTPCGTVLGQRFRAYPERLREHFPDSAEARTHHLESYAGFPLTGLDGTPLGVVAVASRRPLTQIERVESMLKIFAVRVAAEIERLSATEAMQRSAASYRAIFEAAEDAIFIHDWDTGAVLDVNPKACETYGYSREELRRIPVDRISSGVGPYTGDQALQQIRLARLGHCPPFEWQRRNKDGSLHWDEVRLKPVMIEGRHHILAFTREITEHKASLAALQAREEQYRVMFDGSADALVLWDQDIRCVDVNHAFTRLFGYERAESIGGTFPRRFGDEAIRQRLECIRAALQGQEGSLETQAVRKDGSRFDIEVRYLPIRYGGVPHVLSIGRDITERNASLAALQAQEQKYRAIFDGTIDSMVLWSSELRVVDINDAFVQMTGLTREQVIGRHWSERPDADDLPQMLGLIEDALQGRIGQATLNVSRADGSRFEIELRYLPVRFGSERYALGVGRDVSERLQRERQLRDSEAQYRGIFNASADALVLRDADFRIVDVNATYERMSGWSRAEVLGIDRIIANPSDVAQTIRAQHERALAGEPVALEVPLVRRDGERYQLELRGVPILHDGQPHVLYMGRDVSERKQAERALRDSEEQYRAIFNASVDALMLWNSQGQRIDVNPAHEHIFGYPREEVIGRAFEGLHYPQEMVRARLEIVQRALAGEGSRTELEAVRKDGRRIVTDLHTIPFMQRGEPHVLQIARDITDSKTADARLRASEEQYRAIFNASADVLTLWDSRFRRVDVNPAYERMYGYAREEVIGRGFDFPPYSPEHRHLRSELVRRALTGETVQAEHDVLTKQGERRQAEVHAIPFRHDGEPHVLVISRDITERKQAEQALRDSEEQYRAMFNASTDALVLRDSDYRAVDVNPAYAALTGFSRAEVLRAERVLTQPDPAVQERHRAQHQQVLEGEPLQMEVDAVRKDGSAMTLDVRAVPVLYRGRPHVLYASRDITERKAAADALHMREQQYRAIFDGSADAMVLWNADIRFVDVNRAYTRMYGFTREEVVGSTLDGRLPPAAVIERTACIRAALAGEERLLETTTLRKNGEPFFAELRYLPIMHLGVPHVLAIARDITERRAAQAQREALERQLHQAQKMEAIGQLTGGIAHDFNNILTSVIGYLVLGLEHAEALGDAKLQRQLGQAHLAAQRARELIAQMLAFARRQRGERRVLSLAPLVGQTLQLLRATLPSSLTVDFPIDAADDETRVAADAVQLEQVLFNLCINARDAIQGPGSIRVRLGRHAGAWACASCRARGDGEAWVALSVTDSGCGVAPELLERIFEPFTSTKEVGRGSGMGLAMVHGIVHDHGGHVTVDTAPERGSVFRLLLPPADPAAVPVDDTPPAAAGAPAPALCGRVMVVDDEATVGEFMAERLDSWGIDVVLRNDPLQALRWLEDTDNRLDLLITDQTMPRLTGLALAQRATALRPGLPVLLYSGNAEGLDPAELQRHGVCGVLRKPVDAEALRALMQRCLDTKRQRPPS